MNIILIGFMGSGKSTVGKALASKLQWSFVDSDAWIEAQVGASVSRIFKSEGESVFRTWEQRFVHQLENTTGIIACGGGLPCFNDLMTELKQKGIVVYLKASVETLVGRLKSEREDRPLLSLVSDVEFAQEITTRLESREPVYLQAELTVETDGKTTGEIVDELVALIP
ncbi:MAG: shikimate kinase [Flavobacteriia bacterium]|nr:shikimate kinase [Flavobacteriia bacterium]